MITEYVNKQGQRVMRRWERIKDNPSWWYLFGNAIAVMGLLALGVVVMVGCYLFALVRLSGAWLVMQWSIFKCWLVKGRIEKRHKGLFMNTGKEEHLRLKRWNEMKEELILKGSRVIHEGDKTKYPTGANRTLDTGTGRGRG